MQQSDPARLIVVDDEPDIRAMVADYLGKDGYAVCRCASGIELDAVLRSGPADLVVLDVSMPGEDGISIARRIRATGPTPIIMLTALDDVIDRVVGLEVGADDYLTKPFGVAELLARVRALLRRAIRPQRHGAELVAFGQVEVDPVRRTVTRAGEAVHLTPIEFKLLGHLIANAGRVLTHRQLLAEIWGPNHVEHTHYLRVYMAGLRRKLEPDPAFPAHILTESGIGYRLVL